MKKGNWFRFVTIFALLLVLIGADNQIFAARDTSPDPDLASGSYSNDVFTEISQPGNGVYLDAQLSWTKISYPSTATSFNMQVFDGCIDNTWDYWSAGTSGRCTSAASSYNSVSFVVCETNSAGNRIYNSRAFSLAPNTLLTGILDGNCVRYTNLNMLENAWASFNVPLTPPTVLSSRTKNLVVGVYYDNTGSTGNGRVNGFKIRSTNPGAVAGFVGSSSGWSATEPNVLQNRRNGSYSNFNNNYQIRFGTPCTPASNSFLIRWQDADRAGAPGANPSDADVNWVLQNVNTGQTYTSAQAAWFTGQSETSLIGGGGAGSFRTLVVADAPGFFRVQAGDNYRWTWNSFQRNNGIQMWVPHDTVEYYTSCDPVGYLSAASVSCTAISGWAFDFDSSNVSVDVQIYIDGIYRATVTANQPRADVNAAYGITGNHGFSWALPLAFRDGVSHTVTAYALNRPGTAGANAVELSGGPRTFNCPSPYDYTPTIEPLNNPTCSVVGVGRDITVRPRNRNVGGGAGSNYLLRIRAANATTRTYVSPVYYPGGTVISAPLDSIQYSRGGLAAGDSWAPTYPRYRVSTSTPNGTYLYFHSLVNPDSSSNSAWQYSATSCWRVSNLTYNYVPLNPTSTTADRIPGTTTPRHYAGRQFGASAVVRNDGNGTGPTYRQDIYATSAQSSGPNAAYTGQPGLVAPAPNDSRRNTTANNRWTISAAAPHNTQITCRNRVRPARGTSPPSVPITFDGDESNDNTSCVSVYNLRYNIETVTASSVNFSPSTVLPASSFTADVDICNALTAGAVPAGATRGVAPDVRVRIVADTNVSGPTLDITDDINFGATNCLETGVGGVPSFTGTVSATAGLGDIACVRILVNRDIGFSDGNFRSGSQNFRTCINVAEQSYVEVQDSSIWAGGNFDSSPTGFGTPWCALPTGDPNDGYVRGAQLSTFGAYARYIVAATSSTQIQDWGSTSVTGNRLAFANTPSDGQFNSEGLCFTNLRTYLSTDTTVPGISAYPTAGGPNAFPSADGQYVHTGVSDLIIRERSNANSNAIPSGRQITIITDRDVVIEGNLEYDDSTPASSRAALPSLIIVTSGNIEIDESVTRLDGIYYAEGDINTCVPSPGLISALQCTERLIVNGIFIGEDIQFRRTYGGLSGNNPNGGRAASEIFRNTAELFLAEHYMISDFEPELSIDRLVDLPPALN